MYDGRLDSRDVAPGYIPAPFQGLETCACLPRKQEQQWRVLTRRNSGPRTTLLGPFALRAGCALDEEETKVLWVGGWGLGRTCGVGARYSVNPPPCIAHSARRCSEPGVRFLVSERRYGIGDWFAVFGVRAAKDLPKLSDRPIGRIGQTEPDEDGEQTAIANQKRYKSLTTQRVS